MSSSSVIKQNILICQQKINNTKLEITNTKKQIEQQEEQHKLFLNKKEKYEGQLNDFSARKNNVESIGNMRASKSLSSELKGKLVHQYDIMDKLTKSSNVLYREIQNNYEKCGEYQRQVIQLEMRLEKLQHEYEQAKYMEALQGTIS